MDFSVASIHVYGHFPENPTFEGTWKETAASDEFDRATSMFSHLQHSTVLEIQVNALLPMFIFRRFAASLSLTIRMVS